MTLAKREKVQFDGEDITLTFNSNRTVTIPNATKITLAGNGSENKHWYVLMATTEDGVETYEKVRDVKPMGDSASKKVRQLFPRTKKGTTVAEEHAKGNTVTKSEIQR